MPNFHGLPSSVNLLRYVAMNGDVSTSGFAASRPSQLPGAETPPKGVEHRHNGWFVQVVEQPFGEKRRLPLWVEPRVNERGHPWLRQISLHDAAVA